MYQQPFCWTTWNAVGQTKVIKLNYVITYIIWANQKIGSFVYRWLHALEMFEVTCFPAFVEALDVISSILSIIIFLSSGIPGVGGATAAEVLRQRAVASAGTRHPQSGQIRWYGLSLFYVDISSNLTGPRPSEVMK